ncbi:aldo-keto reductase family 1 member A1-like [Nasonia vitripennis]|uniref:NADP-dependent oxidoreductase domain-containing protein n=1 Tax=Nasonia vitripennis TaxID=7425 RepID=A0A7M7GDN2_NASVI|nr:aldo-keto reductase family 1 member A1-like [Nasonia vitripennis]
MVLKTCVFYFLLIFQYCYGVTVPTRTLIDGNEIPVLGFGTYLLTSEDVKIAIPAALKNGYRHIDTAFDYQNEKDIGKALKEWFSTGGKREDLFITSKLPTQANRPSDVAEAAEMTLNNLGLEYVDMYLVHLPFTLQRTPDFRHLKYENGTYALDTSTDHIAVWKEMEKLVKAGKAKSIGLSNFNKTQVLRVWENSEIKPSNLQIETNVYIQQEELYDLCKELGIVITGYSPLGSADTTHLRRRKRQTGGMPPVLEHSVVQGIARKYGKSPAQIVLRYKLQRNIVAIPKSRNPNHIKENIEVFDFQLSSFDMRRLRKLDQNGRYRKFDFLTFNVEHHPEYPFSYRIPDAN